jgi:DNA-binding NarL/FixJ family response regulator
LNDNPNSQEGLRILDQINAHDPGCTAVLLTGYATVEVAVSSLKDHHAFTCLQKDKFQRDELDAIIQRALASIPAVEAAAGSQKPDSTLRQPQSARRSALNARRVLVVEDDAGWRGILSEILVDEGFQVRICGSYGEAYGAVSRDDFDLAIFDLSLGGPTGWDLAKTGEEPEGYRLLLASRDKSVPVVIVSGTAAPEDIEKAFAVQNVTAFLEKQNFDRASFVQAVQGAAVNHISGANGAGTSLTEREAELIELVADGLTNQEIADRLVISLNTVKRHLKAIFRKLDIHNRAGAVAWVKGRK